MSHDNLSSVSSKWDRRRTARPLQTEPRSFGELPGFVQLAPDKRGFPTMNFGSDRRPRTRILQLIERLDADADHISVLFARIGRAVDVHHFAAMRNARVGHQNKVGGQVLGWVLG